MPKMALIFARKLINMYELDQDEIIIGRNPEADIVIDNPAVSRNHAKIVRQGDTYIVKRVFHNWSDEETMRILKNIKTAMSDGGRLLIIEPMIGPPNQEDPAHLVDLIMLVLTSGKGRTANEHSALLQQTGVKVERVVSTDSEVSIVEAFAA